MTLEEKYRQRLNAIRKIRRSLEMLDEEDREVVVSEIFEELDGSGSQEEEVEEDESDEEDGEEEVDG